MTAGERSPSLATRRLFATATDYGMVTLPLAAMLGARIALGSRGGQALAWPPSAEAARTAQWAVPALLTIPVAVMQIDVEDRHPRRASAKMLRVGLPRRA